MISAAEARQLTQQNSAKRKLMLDKVSEAIRNEALQGKSSCHIFVSGLQDAQPSYISVKPSADHLWITQQLEAVGFKVGFGPEGSPYVPRGLADDDGKGPAYQNWTLEVFW